MVSPIEMQGLIPRMQDVTTLKQNDDLHPQFEHVTVQAKQKENEIAHQQSVMKQDNANKKENRFDAKEKGNGSYFQNNSKKNKKEQEEGKVIKKERGSFDVRI